MAFELPRRAIEHARSLTQDEATHVLVDALIHVLAETEEAIEALRLEIAALARRVDASDPRDGA